MVLAVALTRLCPDCDIFTESQICPVCGRDRTFPVAAWLSPLRTAQPPISGRAPAHLRRQLLRRRTPARPAASRIAS